MSSTFIFGFSTLNFAAPAGSRPYTVIEEGTDSLALLPEVVLHIPATFQNLCRNYMHKILSQFYR